jgi:hypothetical protein
MSRQSGKRAAFVAMAMVNKQPLYLTGKKVNGKYAFTSHFTTMGTSTTLTEKIVREVADTYGYTFELFKVSRFGVRTKSDDGAEYKTKIVKPTVKM